MGKQEQVITRHWARLEFGVLSQYSSLHVNFAGVSKSCKECKKILCPLIPYSYDKFFRHKNTDKINKNL